MRRHQSVLFALTMLLTLSACTEWEAVEEESLDQESNITVAIKPLPIKTWENISTTDLWPIGLESAVVVLYPTKLGWGAYLFAKKPGQKAKLVADIHGKVGNLGKFLEANMGEWTTQETPGSNLDHAILGSLKKKPPGGGGPPGGDPKVKHLQAAEGLAQKTAADLAVSAGELGKELL